MKTKDSSLFRSLPQNAAFTLPELLVIVVIVALLATLPLAATSTTKNQVSIAQCASNLRQFGQTMQILATDNSDNLPSNSAGFWAWDINWATGDALTNYASFKVFYCPGTAPRFTDADYLALFNFAPPNLRVLGYATTLPGTPTVALTNWNPTLMPSSSLNTGPALAAQRVFLADATISATGNDYNLRYSYNWTQIPGGYPKNHLSPHLRGIVPAGGNQTMLDGHVEWRAFDDMRPRTSSGTAPVFWW